MSDLDKIVGTLEGQLHSIGASNVADQLKRTLRRFEVRHRISLATNADVGVGVNVNVTEKVFFRVPVQSKVVSAYFTADTANYAGDNTNVRTVAVRKRAGSAFGDTAATVASLTGTTDNALTQWVPKALTLDTAQTTIAANSILSAQVSANAGSTTIAFPAGELVITLEEL